MASIAVLLICSPCSGPVEPALEPVPAAMTVLSGDGQSGRLGEALAQPFVVRVTDAQGDPVESVFVTWMVTVGAGILSGDGSGVGTGHTITATDSDGVARAFLTPAVLGTTTVSARVTTADGFVGSPVLFAAQTLGPAAIVKVSGDDLEGRVGERVAEPHVIRVTDSRGEPMEGVGVLWRLAEGDGDLLSTGSSDGAEILTITDLDGMARAHFIPAAVGANMVVARVPTVPDLPGSPVPFTVDVPGVRLEIALSQFWGPCGFCSPDITVPVATTVEWRNRDAWEHTVTSVSTPPGGTPFDSQILNQNGRFHFAPNVAGTWEYVDRVSGARATLTAE